MLLRTVKMVIIFHQVILGYAILLNKPSLSQLKEGRSQSQSPLGLLVQRHRNEDLPLQVFLLVLQFFLLPLLKHVGHGLS